MFHRPLNLKCQLRNLFLIQGTELLLGLMLIIGCASTEKHWEGTRHSDSITAYEEFLRQHPTSEYNRQAESRLEELRWQNAQSTDSVAEYEVFLEQYPESKYAKEARDRLIEPHWENCQSIDTIESYKDFLIQHPDSEYGDQANTRIMKLQQGLFCSSRKVGLKVHCFGNAGFIGPNIEELSRRFLTSAGIQEISNASLSDSPTLEIRVTGQALADDFYVTGADSRFQDKLRLFTRASISGTISLRGFSLEIARSFKGSKSVTSSFVLGGATLRDEVADTRSSEYERRIVSDRERIVSYYSKPSAGIFVEAFEYSTFCSAISEVMAEAFGANALYPLTRDEDHNVRQAAVQTLGRMRDTNSIELLIAALEDRYVRSDAQRALIRIGEPAVERLTSALHSSDWDVSGAAEEALVSIGEPAVEFFMGVLQNEEEKESNRVRAARSLASIGDTRSIKPLIATLKVALAEDSPAMDDLSSALVMALIKFGESAVDPLIDSIRTEVDEKRNCGWAANILGQIGKPATLPVIDLLQDENSGVRKWAVYILSRIAPQSPSPNTNSQIYRTDRDIRAMNGLILGLEDQDSEVRTLAVKALEFVTNESFGEDYQAWSDWWSKQKK